MSWEDDELLEFERLKQRRVYNDDLILSRTRLREAQSTSRWIELQGKLRGLVATFNMKADRTLLEIVEGSAMQLTVRREDGVLVEIQYASNLYRASFNYPSCPGHNQDYELRVLPVDGNDTAVWIDQKTKDKETVDKIAATTIRQLLRCAL